MRYALTDELGISGLISGKSSEIAFDYEHKIYLKETEGARFYIAPGMHFFYQINKEGNGTNTNLNLLIGADNF